MVLSKYKSPPPPKLSFPSHSSSDSREFTDESTQSDEDVPLARRVLPSNRRREKPRLPHDPNFGASRNDLDGLLQEPTTAASSSRQGGSSQGNSQTMRPTTHQNLNKEVRVILSRTEAQKQQQASASSSGGENSQRFFDQGPNPRALRFNQLLQQEQNTNSQRITRNRPAATSTPSSSNRGRRKSTPRLPHDSNVGAGSPGVEELLHRAEDVETDFGQIMRIQRYQFQKFAQITNDLWVVKNDLLEFRDENRRETAATRQTLAAHETRLREIQGDIRTLLGRGQAAPQQGQLRQVDYICIGGQHRFRFALQTHVLNGMIHYFCPRCPALFKSPEGLRRHIRKGNRTCTCQCEGTPSP